MMYMKDLKMHKVIITVIQERIVNISPYDLFPTLWKMTNIFDIFIIYTVYDKEE